MIAMDYFIEWPAAHAIPNTDASTVAEVVANLFGVP
jgi:hypothetical protein